VRLSAVEAREALAVLYAHGIEGSDARTSLEQIERVVPDSISFPRWRELARTTKEAELESLFGKDAIRAVLALRAPELHRAHSSDFPTVVGICPACGWHSLFLGEGGFVTCSRLECPAPEAATDLLELVPTAVRLAEAAARERAFQERARS
jgi:hypothetical protein